MPTPASDPTPSPFKTFLVELVEAGMEVSREMMVGVRKATDHDQRIAYAAAHDRAARSVRLSIALHERLERAEREAARDVPAPPLLEVLERRVNPQLDLKKAQVRDAVRRSIEQEHEGEDAATLNEALDIFLSEQALSREFMSRPADETVSLFRRRLRLPPHLTMWLPEAEDDGAAAPARPAPTAKPAPS